MAVLTVATVSRAGVDVVGVAADSLGDEWPNSGLEFIEVFNGGGGSINVTLDIRPTLDGAAVVDPVIAIPAAGRRIIGPFPPGIYNDATGRAKVTYSGVASVTIKALKCPPA